MSKISKILFCLTFLLITIICVASCIPEPLDQQDDDATHTHIYSAWGEDSATCTAPGVQTRTCKYCDKTQTRTTPAFGHYYETYTDRVPTCTEPGYSKYRQCSRCGLSSGTEIAAIGHKLTEFSGSTATCIAAGTESATCKNGCGYVETRAVDRLGHSLNAFGTCTTCSKSDIVTLIENGKANFNVIVTSRAEGLGMAAADDFVATLRKLNISVNDPFMDSDPSGLAEYEIIIGSGALLRGDACNVTTRYLGQKGSLVKIVGNKIIIAGATASITNSVFDKFVREYLGITSSTKSITYLEADSSCCYEDKCDYALSSVTIVGNDLAKYEYVLDVTQASVYGVADIMKFNDNLFDVSGYYLNYTSVNNMTANGKYFIVRCVDDAGEKGFRAYVDGDDLIVECSYKNSFNSAFVKFANSMFLANRGNVEIGSDFYYEDAVNVVYYEDFGANGDDELCDFEFIYNAHMFANAGGQKVYGKAGATYYISAENFTKTIPVKTDVDFLGATFIVNDFGEDAYKYRKLALFTLARDNPDVKYTDSIKDVPVLDADGNPTYNDNGTQKMTTDGVIDEPGLQGVTIAVGQSDFSWLAPYLTSKSLVKIENKLHKDFIRHGSNQNSGATRRDIFVVNADGTVEADSLPVFAFDNISTIEIYRADDTAITVENGNFINICCRTVASTQYVINGADNDPDNDIVTSYANKFHEYQRGFIVYRTNATIKNVTHSMEAEPDLGWYLTESGHTPDGKHSSYGSRHESYPYYGFVLVSHSYNFTLADSQLTGHTTYYEDKPATASTGWKIPNPVPMGTYDYVLEYSDNVKFENVIQVNKSEQLSSAKDGDFSYLTDTRYWGIMSSNGTKNLYFLGCSINRFDAHRGFWNATLKDTYIGHSFQVIGGGTLYVENVTKASKSNFMTFRGDYGATFEGDVIIKDCTYEARKTYSSWAQSKPNAVGGEATGYIMDSGFYAYNNGYSTGKDGYLGGYWYWDFGYTCYMPINVTIDNFTSKSKKTYVYDDLPDIIFESTYKEGEIPGKFTVRYPYVITKTITQKNMKNTIPTCSGTFQRNTSSGYKDYPEYTYNKLKSIPVTKINIG